MVGYKLANRFIQINVSNQASHNFYHSSWRSGSRVYSYIGGDCLGNGHFHLDHFDRELQKIPIFLHMKKILKRGEIMVYMTLQRNFLFLNKGAILRELSNLPEGTYLELDVPKGGFDWTTNCSWNISRICVESQKSATSGFKVDFLTKESFENPESYHAFFGIEAHANSH